MTCPGCGREPPENAHFCIYCGTPLHGEENTASNPQSPEEGAAESTGPPGPEDLASQVQSLGSALRDLSAELSGLSRRVSALEQGTAAPRPSPPPAPARAVAPQPSAGGPSTTPRLTTAPQRAVPGTPSSEVSQWLADWNWEWLLGGNWLARIGVVALIIGVGFFLKLAIDNQWLSETGRVVLGLVGGLALLAAGEYWQRRYPVWAQAVTGGGLAILYLSIFAAFSLYGLVPPLPAFGFFFLVTLAAAGLALRYESLAIAVLAIIGGFITPVLLREQLPDQRLLLAYVLVLDLGVLALATFRNWQWFTLLALLGSLGLYWFWWSELQPGLLLAQVGITMVFLVFVGATTLFHVLWRRPAGPADQTLMALNAAAYFGISYGLLFNEIRPWMGGFTLLLAVFYGLLGYVVHRRGPELKDLSFFSFGIGLIFLTIAAPVQFGGPWVSMAWAAQGIVLMGLSFHLGLYQLRLSSLATLALMVAWLLAVETPNVDSRTFLPIINFRFLAFASGVLSLYMVAYLVWRWRDRPVPEWESQWAIGYLPILLLAANGLTLWTLSFEIVASVDSDYFNVPARNADNVTSLALSVLWATYAAALIVLGIVRQWRWARVGGLALLVIPVAKLFVYDVFVLERGFRVAAFLGLGAALVAGGFLYQRNRQAIRGFLME